MKPKLFGTLPPTVDRCDPRVISWRQDRHEQAIEHLYLTKLDKPSIRPSWRPVIGVIIVAALGLTGLVSPFQLNALLKLFVP